MNKRPLITAAVMAAALVLEACTVTIGNTDSSGELYYRSSRPDSTAENTVPETETSAAATTAPEPEEEDITMPGDNELAVLVGDDHQQLLKDCNSMFEQLGGKLTLEVAQSETLYDTLAKGEISGKPIDVSTFDNGMLFPYLAVEEVAAPIDREISMPELPEQLQEVSELFSINNWHYVMPLAYGQAYRLMYDTKTLKKYGLEDPADLPDSSWTVEKLCEMSEAYHAKGGETPLAGNYGEPIHISSGKPLAIYERDPAGFFNNLFDPNMAETTELLFQLKEHEMKMDSEFASPKEALEKDVLFYSATCYQAEKEPLPDTVKTMPLPTLEGLDRHYELKVYGLTLMKQSKHKEAAGCYFACAAKTAESVSAGKYTGDYALADLDKGVYPYDKGISLGVSYSPAHMNEDLSLAVSPLIYTGLENKDDWGGVCAYYSKLFINDLTELNNKISENIYGD